MTKNVSVENTNHSLLPRRTVQPDWNLLQVQKASKSWPETQIKVEELYRREKQLNEKLLSETRAVFLSNVNVNFERTSTGLARINQATQSETEHVFAVSIHLVLKMIQSVVVYPNM